MEDNVILKNLPLKENQFDIILHFEKYQIK